MYGTFRNVLCFTLALLLAFTPPTSAQQTNHTDPRPVPPQIVSSHTVFVANGGGPNFFNAFSGGPDRSYSQLISALEQWKRYQIVDSPTRADLIFEIHSVAPVIGVASDDAGLSYNPQLILRILDSKTNTLLWTTTANVKAAGGQSSRDKGFDESVDVLVDQLRQLTGEKLETTQVKAIRSNNQMPTSKKVLIGVGIGAVVGFSIFGIYKVTHPPALPALKPPACPDPPFCSA
jgi:hypothetical protein